MCKRLYTLLLLFSCLSVCSQADTVQQVMPFRYNAPAQQKKPYLILISVDGMRWDYLQKHGAVFLDSMASAGVKARYMLPSFPSYTFPNHYTITTGLYPSHHGLVSNYYFDRKRRQRYSMSAVNTKRDGYFYGGIPIWLLAEQQQLLTASIYWVGTEADIGGMLPSYYYYYNEKISIDDRVQAVKSWLQMPEERRPHLISFYFPEVDHDGHYCGPDAPETKHAVQYVDRSIRRLVKAVSETGLDVNFIVTSDHGMSRIANEKALPMPAIDTAKFVVIGEDQMLQVYAKDGADVEVLYHQLKTNENNYKVYRRAETPKRWHFDAVNDCYNRIGDLVLVPVWPHAFNSRGRAVLPGAHGYDPYRVRDMRTIFLAWGPQFTQGKTIPPFSNVHVYPLLARVLGLNYSHPIDGDDRLLRRVLR